MLGRIIKLVLLLVLTFTNLIVLASAITVSVSTGDVAKSVSSASSYHLDDSTSLHESSVLNSASMVQNRQASGSGNNAISQYVAGNGYSTKNDIVNSGTLNTQASLAADGEDASYSQGFAGVGNSAISQTMTGNGYTTESSATGLGILSLSTSSSASSASASLNHLAAGSGYADLAVSGTQGMDTSEQRAGVAYGEITSSQSLSAGAGVSTSQTTKLNGEGGSVESNAISVSNVVLESGSFTGLGVLDAGITSDSDHSAGTTGKISIDGTTYIDDKDLQGVSSGNQMTIKEGIKLASQEGLGSFQTNVANMDRETYEQSMIAAQANAGGSSSSYRLGGPDNSGKTWILKRWNEKDPNIKLWLKDDSNLNNIQDSNNNIVPSNDVVKAIGDGANVWHSAVKQDSDRNLFMDGTGAVEKSSTVTQTEGDGQNVIAFYDFPNKDALAYTTTHVEAPLKYGFWSMKDFDISFNNLYKWSTTGVDGTPYHDGDPIDIETNAIHELGHGIGLGDLYAKSDKFPWGLDPSDPRTNDHSQVMNNYDDVQRTLGSGDLQGVHLLYDYRPVALQANNGQYVCAEGGGGQDLKANRDWIGDWETFEIVNLGDNNAVLRSNNGQYVCAESGGWGNLAANRMDPLAWETFKLSDLGDNKIALQAVNNLWVCAENGGGKELVSNRLVRNAWETFNLVDLTETPVALRANNGQYVCAEDGGWNPDLYANRNAVGAWEKFQLVELGNSKVALKAVNGKYLSAENGGGSTIDSNRDWIGPWETFERVADGSGGWAFRASNGQLLCAENGGGDKLLANRNAIGPWETFSLGILEPIQPLINGAIPGETIELKEGVYKENLKIDKSANVNGAGAGKTFLDGGQAGSVFTIGAINSNIDVTLSGMTIQNGKADTIGGVYNKGRLTIEDCAISNNNGGTSSGGIGNDGSMTVKDTTITDNIVTVPNDWTAVGGAGICNSGTLTVTGSIISRNKANGGLGGGILNAGSATITDSTISDNNARVGGGLRNDGQMTITDSIMSGNIAEGNVGGGGIENLGTLFVGGTSQIVNNQALYGTGGGIWNFDGTLTLDGIGVAIKFNKAWYPAQESSWYSGYGVYSNSGVPITSVGFDPATQVTDNTHI